MQKIQKITQIQINFPQSTGSGPGMSGQFPITAMQTTQVMDASGSTVWQNQSQTALIDADFTPDFLAQSNALLAAVGLALSKV